MQHIACAGGKYFIYKKNEAIKRGWIEILPRLNPISYEKPSC
jgi:hypothetical protein